MSSIPRRPSAPAAQRRHRPDYWLLILTAILLCVGLVVVYAISPSLSQQKGVGVNYYVNKQLLAVALGVIAFIICANLPIQWWRRLQMPLIIAAAIAAIGVRIWGEEVNGAYRWIQLGGFSFQVVELIKFALLVWLAGFLVDRAKTGQLSDTNRTFKPLLVVLGVLGLVVAVLQSDLGSMGVIVAIMGVMVFVAGMPMKRLMMIGGIILIGTILAIGSSSYRRDRLMTYLNPEKNSQTTGYQTQQALIAIGSGGLTGKGLGHSVQATGYLPEAANDSIFAIMAEKFGFIGITAVLGLFIAFYSRLKRIIEHTPDDFSRLLVTGILAWLSTQAIINIGAMLGLLPLKGITLPFISYGGTSLLFITGAVGVAFQVSRYATFGAAAGNRINTEGKGYVPRKYAVEYRSRI